MQSTKTNTLSRTISRAASVTGVAILIPALAYYPVLAFTLISHQIVFWDVYLAYYSGFLPAAVVIFLFGAWLKLAYKPPDPDLPRDTNSGLIFQFHIIHLFALTLIIATLVYLGTRVDVERIPIVAYAVMNSALTGIVLWVGPKGSDVTASFLGNLLILSGTIGLALIQTFGPEIQRLAQSLGGDGYAARNIALVVAFSGATVGGAARSMSIPPSGVNCRDEK